MTPHLNKNPVFRHGIEPLQFVQVPNDFARAALPLAVRALIVELASHKSGCYSISVVDLAKNAGCGWKTMNRVVLKALESEYLARQEFHTVRGHAFYEYHVRLDRPFNAEELAAYSEPVLLSATFERADHETVRDIVESPSASILDPVIVISDSTECNICHRPVVDDAFRPIDSGTVHESNWHIACLEKLKPSVNWSPESTYATT